MSKNLLATLPSATLRCHGTGRSSRLWLVGLALAMLCNCAKEEVTPPIRTHPPTTTNPPSGNEWSVPKDEVFDGGPGKDGIPALENPMLITADEATFLRDDDLVVGYKSGNDIRAYPHLILDWHEIINDEVGMDKVAITYCPLTGSAIGWNRVLDGTETTFGVSGLLYNTNLMPYDRASNSTWSQMLNAGVHGSLQDRDIELYPLVETNWKTWREMYPETAVVSLETGYHRNYSLYPYGSYKENSGLFFPISVEDQRMFSKERVLGVILDWGAKIYRFQDIDPDGHGKIGLIYDTFGPQPILVVGNIDFMVAYKPFGIKDASEFSPLQNELPLVFKDNLGNKYDAFGVIQEGPNLGERLEEVESYIAFFFAFGTFYPTPELYQP